MPDKTKTPVDAPAPDAAPVKAKAPPRPRKAAAPKPVPAPPPEWNPDPLPVPLAENPETAPTVVPAGGALGSSAGSPAEASLSPAAADEAPVATEAATPSPTSETTTLPAETVQRREQCLWPSSEAIRALDTAQVGDPFSFLGAHRTDLGWLVRTFQPGATSVEAVARDSGKTLMRLQRLSGSGVFGGWFPANTDAKPVYDLRIDWGRSVQVIPDPYSFGEVIPDTDMYFHAQGTHRRLIDMLGAKVMEVEGVNGVRFAVWAPSARRVSVVGAFNNWDGRRHPMRRRYPDGVWEFFLPGVKAGEAYGYEILGANGELLRKADPVATQALPAPATVSVVPNPQPFAWTDDAWMKNRAARQAHGQPMSVYEVQASSWKRPEGRTLDWDGLTRELIPYVKDMGFTHIELMPIMAHPFGGSWGYQPVSMFAPQPDWGSPESLARFIDACHAAGIGVILDWVPAHFPSDSHGLARFDGTALYEYADPREGFHHDWNTLIYNFAHPQVAQFLLASALHWVREFHLDGLRVDAVASMLYRDYSRPHDQWLPNIYGGRENLEAVGFVKRLNQVVGEDAPGAIVIAEESTAWPGVTAPLGHGGLGFSRKWNMGWMNDTLRYVELDPIFRAFNHELITFGLVYGFNEQFMLPLSHDEVVHGKGSLISKMPGSDEEKFATLRALYGLMWGHPGEKLLFMGGEIAQYAQWNHDTEIDWPALDSWNAGPHRGVQSLVRDLNTLYRRHPALHAWSSDRRGFDWMLREAAEQSLYAFCRYAEGAPPVLVVCNFTPVTREVQIGVPYGGRWQEIFNSQSPDYAGSGGGNHGQALTAGGPHDGRAASLRFFVPPLSTLYFLHDSTSET